MAVFKGVFIRFWDGLDERLHLDEAFQGGVETDPRGVGGLVFVTGLNIFEDLGHATLHVEIRVSDLTGLIEAE